MPSGATPSYHASAPLCSKMRWCNRGDPPHPLFRMSLANEDELLSTPNTTRLPRAAFQHPPALPSRVSFPALVKKKKKKQSEGKKQPVMSRMESATHAPTPFGSSLEADGYHIPSSSAVSCALQGGASFRRECVNKHICHFSSKQIASRALIIRQGSSDCFIMQMRRRRQRRVLGALFLLLSFFLLSV